MKTILSLLTAMSLLFGQLNAPANVPLAQGAAITETVSPFPTPLETQTPTPSATEGVKETATAQPTPTIPAETSSPEAAPATEPSVVEKEIPILSLRTDPEYISVGANLTLYWEVGEESLKEQFELQVTLAEGLSLEKQGEMKYDEASRILFIPINSQSGELQLLVGEVSTDLVISAALVAESGEIRYETKLLLPVKETFVLDEQGGTIVADESRIKIEIPANALVEASSIDIGKPSGDSVPPFSLSGNPFEITAHGEASKEEQTHFSEEIKINVSYAELEIPEELEGNLHLYWYNPDINDWEALPTTVDTESKTIEGFTDHFTVFDINVNNWQSSRAPTVDAFQVSSFTGAAAYSLPIEVPPGPGGFQPNLVLSYNSQIVDQSTTATQASWVGMGWSLDTGSINLDSHGTYYDSDDTFFLNVAGVSTRLLKDASGVYHSIDENFWRIQESAGGGFEVWDKQGNIYYFQSGAPFPYQVGSCAGQDAWIEWDNHTLMLTKIKNNFGQEILYTYTDQTRSIRLMEYYTGEARCYPDNYIGVTAKYPSTITYAGGKYRIRFDIGSAPNRLDYRSSWDAGDAFQIYQKYRLQNVYVEQDVEGDGTFETVLRRYELQYESDTNTANLIFPGFVWTAGGKTSTLKSVKQYGVGGVSALPATTFTYGDNLHLTRADNGYGGAVEFDYDFWYLPDVARGSYSITQLFGKSGYPCRLEDPSPWGGNDVNCGDGYKDPLNVRGTAWAGAIKNAPSSSNQNTSYDLIRPGGMYKLTASVYMANTTSLRVGLYDGVNYNLLATSSPYYLMLPANASTLSPLIEITGGTGYGLVGGFTFQLLPSVYRVSEKRLFDGNGHSYPFTYDYTNNGVDTAKFNDTYVVTSEACTNWSCVDNYFTEKYSEFRGNGKVTVTAPDGTKTITEFHQDDIFKGRPISIISNDGTSNVVETDYSYAFTPLPCEVCIYWAGLSRNFVYTTSEATTVYGSVGGSAQTTYAYDSTYGNLTSQSQYVNGSLYRTTTMDYFPTDTSTAYLVSLPARQQVKNAAGTVLAESLNLYDGANTYTTAPTAGTLTANRTRVSGAQYSQMTIGYDAWGNKTTLTTYSGYGTASSAPTVGAATMTTAYDSTFHAYPISQTTPPTPNVPAGLTTTWNYDYDGNSVDDYILGLPTKETDPNNNMTSAQYDVFGRMTKLIRPGDSSASPTIAIGYTSGFPFTTTITQKINASQSYQVIRTYDGIGRQTKIVSGGTIVDTVYQSPTVTKQSVPYTGAPPNLFTTTTIDPTAHTSTTTAPDGASAVTTTNGLSTTFTDARGNVTTSISDVLGRVLTVTPPTGPAVSYSYDQLDRLTTATRGGVTTSLNYDNAGRKVNMTDPDMGYWVYDYDALGNLKTQTDARGCTLTLGYDSVNRLSSKTSSGSGCGTQVNTSYTYDNGVNGKGMRTGMSDASGSSSWTYDTRGRIASEVKVISNQSFSTSWTYNSGDLPITMTYPDGEIVTYNYNDRMLLNSVIGTNTYVQSTLYDSAGRMDDRLLGNGLTQNYSYYGWTEAAMVDGTVTGQGGRLKNLTVGSLQNLTYAYDRSGNVRAITDTISNETQSFTYDSLDRLISANATGGPAPYSETYAYNATTGNLINKGTLTLQYNDSAHAHAVTNAGSNTYSYDGNGNQTTRVVAGQTYNLAYDAEGRLVSVTTGTGGFMPINEFSVNPPRFVPFQREKVSQEQAKESPLQQSGFPSTSILDTFNRVDGAIGSSWTGYTTEYAIASNQLDVVTNSNDTYVYWGGTSFSADQEAYITFSQVDADSAEQSLLLKSQSNNSLGDGVIEVLYDANADIVQVWTYSPSQGWVQRGANIPVTFINGDQFGARAKLNGDVDVYKNGTLLATRNVSAWTFSASGGYIGVWLVNASDALLDNFGGGSVSSGATVTPTKTVTPTITPTSTVTKTPTKTNTPAGTNTPTKTSTPAATFTPSFTPTFTATSTSVPLPTSTQPPAFTSANFIYDGDGRRVKSIIGGETTLFVGAHYEVTNGVVTKYYFAGAQRIAMRKNGTLSYMLSDHLGSTSMTTNASGAMTSQMKYKAWGEVRFASGTNPTKYTYTGQYSNVSDFGLMFYNARWYDPVSGRFAQADTIVPAGVQGLDRYAYVNNSPVNFVDPTGHFTKDAIEKYLWNHCEQDQTCYDNLLQQWQDDKDWWNMLLTAQAGDKLFGISTFTNDGSQSQFEYTFMGLGNDVLAGILLTGNSNSMSVAPGDASLVDIQAGFKDSGSGVGFSLNWVGFYRTDERGKPSFYVKPGYELLQYQTPEVYSRVTDGAALLPLGPFMPTAPIPGAVASFVTGYSFSTLVSDLLNIQPEDVNVYIGPVYFNFQLDIPTDTWIPE